MGVRDSSHREVRYRERCEQSMKVVDSKSISSTITKEYVDTKRDSVEFLDRIRNCRTVN